MLLISENPGTLSQSLFHQKQSSNFIMLPSVNTLVCLETGKGPCDFIICSQREPEQTSWQGDYFGIWIPLSNYYAIPGGLIYCIPRYAGRSGKKIVGLHRRNKRAFLRRKKKGLGEKYDCRVLFWYSRGAQAGCFDVPDLRNLRVCAYVRQLGEVQVAAVALGHLHCHSPHVRLPRVAQHPRASQTAPAGALRGCSKQVALISDSVCVCVWREG